jgi:hypothetical protein
MPLPLSDVFADLPDPRSEVNRRHLLTDILTIALCGVISGADGWEDIAEYGRSKEDFFRRFLPLPNGIPSHDTFYRVFARLDPAAFSERVGRWMAAACEATGLTPIAIDGKSARRAKAATATGCLHTVSAWATASGLTLGQVAVPDGSNEIAVVPDLLRVLDLAGAIVTLDAAGCQTENARLIRDGGGHYLLAVKGNQPNLHAAVRAAGLPLEEALIQSGRRRLRPVLMTSLAAALGMLPLAYGIGSGADMLKPLAIAVMGALAISVLLSLVATPAVYYLLLRVFGRVPAAKPPASPPPATPAKQDDPVPTAPEVRAIVLLPD